MRFEGITAEHLFISEIMTANTDIKLRDKLIKEKKLELKERIEVVNENTHKRKNRKRILHLERIHSGHRIAKINNDGIWNNQRAIEVQKVNHRYQDVNKNEVKFRGKIPADF